jgi:zinc D-Ala-D-Ala carboxypeptidase
MNEMATQLSEHFTLEELVHSDVALRKGIDNATDDPVVITALTALARNILEPIRAQFGPFFPTSGYRCPALNEVVGGAGDSQHMQGQAADIVIPGVTRPMLAQWIERSLDFDQLILELYTRGEPDSGWVHCSYVSPTRNRKQGLTYPPQTRRYLPGLLP